MLSTRFMKRFLCALAVTALVVVPSVARSQTIPSTVGAGPHGYDWNVGTWSCTNSMAASPMGGPTSTTETVSRTSSGAILYHTTGNNFDFSFYNVYVPKKKMWVSPFSGADGSHGSESTTQTGRKIVWPGTAFDPAGKSMQVRDTLVYESTKYSDLGEYLSAGTWKKQYRITCTRK